MALITEPATARSLASTAVDRDRPRDVAASWAWDCNWACMNWRRLYRLDDKVPSKSNSSKPLTASSNTRLNVMPEPVPFSAPFIADLLKFIALFHHTVLPACRRPIPSLFSLNWQQNVFFTFTDI